MRYQNVYINKITYDIPEERVSTAFLEEQLHETYEFLGLLPGQVESLTGIRERRFWPINSSISMCATLAAKKIFNDGTYDSKQIQMLVFAGVCRDHFEPATACAIASSLGISDSAEIFDLSNACLGVLNAIIHVANAIELGQIQFGLVVTAESSRDIIDTMIGVMKNEKNMASFISSLATLTGGSGAAAILLSNQKTDDSHKLLGGVIRQDTRWHEMCRWGISSKGKNKYVTMYTDSTNLLKHGIALAKLTYEDFLGELSWNDSPPDKFICHQIGLANQQAIHKALNIHPEQDYSSFEMLGNMGSAALPVTAALATQNNFLTKNDRVGFLGIGSGLNCLMLGIEW